MRVVWRFLFVVCVSAVAQSWTTVESGTTANLRGVSANSGTVWVSGDKGTVRRTTDNEQTWRSVAPAGVADLDFRDIEAVDAQTAFLLSSGEGSKSRIYKTTDGGASWILLATNLEPKGFWDCMSFWDPTHGIIVGDPIGSGDGKFTILTTSDGVTWQTLKGPSANKDEGAFAASGTCVFTRGTREAWFGTGGVGGGRVFHTEDAGQTWSVAKTPVRHDSASAGIFSLAFSDGRHGMAVGGDYDKPTDDAGNCAITADGGKTWEACATGPSGYRSAVTYAWNRWIVTGTSGSDRSPNDGKVWGIFGVGFNAMNGGWAVGPNGAIGRLLNTFDQLL